MQYYNLKKQSDINGLYDAFRRRRAADRAAAEAVAAEILQKVKEEGDAALYEYTLRFDKADLRTAGLAVSAQELEQARRVLQQQNPGLLQAMEHAAENIRLFHEHEIERSWRLQREDGSVFGVQASPLARAGVYVPGGRAPLPSSVLMNVIPAQVAGVDEIIMCTPPGADGAIDPVILAAAQIAGVHKIYKVGGAQAIAAMAYGTESIPAVDKITGPGNAYVAAAKARVFGICGIDMIAGPSEILIIADQSANPEFVAADMLSQAEHDPMAASVLLTTEEALAEQAAEALKRRLPALSRSEIAGRSLESNGVIVITENLEQAAAISDFIAPEHLELCVADPETLLKRVRNAGAIFCGHWSPEPMGDYYCGSNHILPTGGTARFSSPLGVWDFMKRTSVIHYSRAGFLNDSAEAALFAQAEGLTAHAESILSRTDRNRERNPAAEAQGRPS